MRGVPRILFVPGFTQTAGAWRAAADVVEETCDVTLLDVPTRETFVATARAIGQLGKRGVYAGYSMGGRLCLQLALDHPEIVRALVLVSASPGLATAQARAERMQSDEELARSIERDGVDAFIDGWLAQPMFATIPADARRDVERRRQPAAFLTHCLRVLGTGAMPSLWERLPELRVPVALVTGTLDEKFDEIARRMLERITADAVHVRLEGGHALPLERPGVLGGFIAAFSAQHG